MSSSTAGGVPGAAGLRGSAWSFDLTMWSYVLIKVVMSGAGLASTVLTVYLRPSSGCAIRYESSTAPPSPSIVLAMGSPTVKVYTYSLRDK